jgi:hypothetical protein
LDRKCTERKNHMKKMRILIAFSIAAFAFGGFAGTGIDYASTATDQSDAASKDRGHEDTDDRSLDSGAATQVPPLERRAPEGAGESGSRPSEYPPYHKPEK